MADPVRDLASIKFQQSMLSAGKEFIEDATKAVKDEQKTLEAKVETYRVENEKLRAQVQELEKKLQKVKDAVNTDPVVKAVGKATPKGPIKRKEVPRKAAPLKRPLASTGAQEKAPAKKPALSVKKAVSAAAKPPPKVSKSDHVYDNLGIDIGSDSLSEDDSSDCEITESEPERKTD